MPLSDPQKLQIVNAIRDELAAIQAGPDYHYTPATVALGYRLWNECESFPAYFVAIGSGGQPPEEVKSRRRMRHFTVVIYGHIHDETDPVTPLVKAMADVEKAVFANPTHGGIATKTTLESEPDTDDGGLAPYGTFRMPLSVSYYQAY